MIAENGARSNGLLPGRQAPLKFGDVVAENKQADEAIMEELTAPLHQLKFILKKIGIFYILKNIHKNL